MKLHQGASIRLADGTLVSEPDLAKTFPFIPGLPSPEGIANPTLVYDFGPGFKAADLSGYISFEPPEVIGVLPTYLPSIDADRNESAGVRTVLLQVPLGTYLGWNVFASGSDKGKFCSLTASYVPFAQTSISDWQNTIRDCHCRSDTGRMKVI